MYASDDPLYHHRYDQTNTHHIAYWHEAVIQHVNTLMNPCT